MTDVSRSKRVHNYTISMDQVRHLDIDDKERIERCQKCYRHIPHF